jgi:CheY-like chemotaxis protein
VKRVLLIDDDQRFLQALARELLAHGYRVDEAADGLEGIDKAVQEAPDFAVVDLIMPRVGGGEVVSFFRQNPYLSSTPIVLLSVVLAESAPSVDAIEADCVLARGSSRAGRLLASTDDRISAKTDHPARYTSAVKSWSSCKSSGTWDRCWEGAASIIGNRHRRAGRLRQCAGGLLIGRTARRHKICPSSRNRPRNLSALSRFDATPGPDRGTGLLIGTGHPPISPPCGARARGAPSW